jgi:benzil reductase ((S)-benzoin forming)
MTPREKHIIITGASRGFGRDLAMRLAESGTVLHLIARSDMSDLIHVLEARGAGVRTWKQDLTRTEELHGLMTRIAESITSQDAGFLGLINNAGMIEPVGPAGKYSHDVFKNNLEINFVAPILLTHAFMQLFQDWNMVKRIVMISSGAAKKPYHGWSHYCSTKAGVDMFVRTAGIEQVKQRHPVEIMAFNPGRIATDMQKTIRETSEEDFPMVHDFISAWKEGSIGDSDEIAGRLSRVVLAEFFPSGEILSHRDI